MDTSVRASLVREIDKAILTGQISQENFFQLTESSGVPKVDAIRIWNGATCGTLDDNVLDRLLDSLCGYQGLVEEYLQSLPPDRQKVNKTVLRRTQLASRQLFGKEFVSLAPEELVAVFSSMGILARSNLSLYSNVIKKFAEWCLEQRRAFPICDILNRPENQKCSGGENRYDGAYGEGRARPDPPNDLCRLRQQHWLRPLYIGLPWNSVGGSDPLEGRGSEALRRASGDTG